MKPITAALAVLLLSFVCGGCGDGAGPGPTTGDAATTDGVPVLPAVSTDEKARFALERLLRGPLPRTSAFAIPNLHLLNLEHSRADLAALGDSARKLLADPALIARLTNPDGDRNPWHNVLQVLPMLDPLSTDLAAAWCRPVLATRDLQLQRRALRVLLAATDGERLAPLLLELFELRPRDRELSPAALSALLHLGDPWRERALEVALRRGSPLVWSVLPDFLRAATADGGPAIDALAWWAVLAERSGPVEVSGTLGSIAAPWYEGRLLVDDAVWPRDPALLEVATRAVRVLAPPQVVDAAGYLPRPEAESSVLSWRQVHLSGRASAAQARCALAESAHPAFQATVTRDLLAADVRLVQAAENCAVTSRDPAEAEELAGIVLDAFLEDLATGAQPAPTGIPSALHTVFDQDPARGGAAAARILRSARPQDVYRTLIQSAHDLLAGSDPDALTAELSALLLRGDGAADRATGLLLVRRGRNPRYAPLLDTLLDDAEPADARLLKRLLIWLHSAPRQTDPEPRRAFATRYAAWVETASDAEARGLAPGLLDLGDPGAEAYAAGLTGERRTVFVQGLLGRSGLVALRVAEALLGPVDANTSPARRRAVLIAAYRTAPPAAAPLLAALRERLAPGARSEVDDVLAVVRHRTDRLAAH